jgi:hypothetical protein
MAGFVPDEDGLMDGVDDPFRAGRASGPGWHARSRSGGDPPAVAKHAGAAGARVEFGTATAR